MNDEPSKIEIRSPYDDQIVGEVSSTRAEEANAMLERAARLARDRRHRPSKQKRIALLENAAAIIKTRSDEIVRTAVLEGGKPITDVKAELAMGAAAIRDAVAELHTDDGRAIPMGLTPSSEGRLAFTTREPIGAVLAISAFNHVFANIMFQVVPALAAGCPIVIKPASKTPLTCLAILAAFKEAGVEEGQLQVALCNGETVAKLAADERAAFVHFIGSAAVGWKLRANLAPGSTCSLEHGGAAPVIVDEAARVDEVVPLLVRGGFYHAGQVCVSVQRVFAHTAIYDRLVAGLKAKAAEVIVGDPLEPATQMGPLIGESQANRIESLVAEARQAGAELLIGGERLGKTMYAPTILLNPPRDAKVSAEEVFGPIICVYRCKDIDDAIERANEVPFAFNASVMSQDIDACLHAASRLSATTVLVNDQTAFRTTGMPFAVRRRSGLGIGGVIETIRSMAPEKLIVLKSAALA